ncbi:MAG: pre-peptidase C-terminal domain-containing protein [Acidobacteria bacterium]|nr:pre-peptidase C-terminal domain-containing protein [Acidobacteriota bacterium]
MHHLSHRILFVILLLAAFPATAAAQTSLSGAAPQSPRAPDAPEPLSRRYPEINPFAAQLHKFSVTDESQRTPSNGKFHSPSPLRVGSVHRLDQPIDARRGAIVRYVREGRLSFQRIEVTGAFAARLRLVDLDLGPGARLFVCSSAEPDRCAGPYEGRGPNSDGELWTPPLPGAELFIEYFEPNNSSPSPSRDAYRIDAVSRIHTDLPALASQMILPCHLEVTPEWSEIARSVALITFATEKGEFACTGTLLNSSRPNKLPLDNYLLTANHCVPDARTASSVFSYFLYDSGAGPVPAPTTFSANLLATGANADYSLLRIVGNLPAGVRLSGWTTEMPGAGAPITSITHPGASWKRIAFGGVTAGDCPPDAPAWFCEQFLSVRWNSGIVEEGSSGGGLWTGPAFDPKLAGVLSQGFSNCGINGPDFYGRFDRMFPALNYHLTGQSCFLDLRDRFTFIGGPGGVARARVRRLDGLNCGFDVVSTVPWIGIRSGETDDLDGHTNEKSIVWSVDPNPSAEPRLGFVIIAGQSVTVFQAGTPAACASLPITAGQPIDGALTAADCRSVYDADAYADRYTFTASASQQVSISLTSNSFDTFLTLLGPDGSVIQVSDDANSSTNSRIPGGSDLTIALPASGEYTVEVSSFEQNTTGSYRVTLAAGGCSLSVNQTQLNISGDGGPAGAGVQVGSGFSCGWRAVSPVDWISPQPDYTFGNGAFQVFVAPNPGDEPRTAVVNVGGVPVTIRQEVRCRFSVSGQSHNIGAEGGFINLTVTRLTGALCYWEGPSDAGWIISSGVVRHDDGGSIRLHVQPNFSLNERSLTVMIANVPVTVTQQGSGVGCPRIVLERDRLTEGRLDDNSCRTGGWQSFNPGNVPPNRSQFYTFTASAGERVTIAMSSDEFDTAFLLYDAAGFQMNVPLSIGGLSQRFLTQILPMDGDYTIEAAASYRADSGAFKISLTAQSNAGCSPYPSKFKLHFGADGGTGSIDITNVDSTGSNCQWTAASSTEWAAINGSGQGVLPGQLTVDVMPNTGLARSAIITVAGLPLQIVQDGSGIATVSSASFDSSLAPGSLASVFGDNFGRRTEAATSQPLPLSLWSTTVIVKDSDGVERRAPLLYVSSRQVNFQIPVGTRSGPAEIRVMNNEFSTEYPGPFSVGMMTVEEVAPSVFTANGTGSGAPAALLLRVGAGGAQSYENAFEFDPEAGFVPRPIDLGGAGEQVYLILYATGMRNLDGVALRVMIDGVECPVLFAGPAPGFTGLDQLNVLLPEQLRGRGAAAVVIDAGGRGSNPVTLAFQ